MLDHRNFLETVRSYVSIHPDAAAYIQDYVARGIEEALADANQRAADMETALVLSLARRNRRHWAGVIAEKIRRWNGQCSINWTQTLIDLDRETKIDP